MAAAHSTRLKAAEQRTIREAIRIIDDRLRQPGAVFIGPSAAMDYVKLQLAELPHEVFAAMFLDTKYRLIAWEELSHGTLNAATVYAREVVKTTLRHNAAAVIFAHNHPSGIAEPSEVDRQLTRRLRDALALIDVFVADHFVVGYGRPVSFAERGWL